MQLSEKDSQECYILFRHMRKYHHTTHTPLTLSAASIFEQNCVENIILRSRITFFLVKIVDKVVKEEFLVFHILNGINLKPVRVSLTCSAYIKKFFFCATFKTESSTVVQRELGLYGRGENSAIVELLRLSNLSNIVFLGFFLKQSKVVYLARLIHA